VSFTFVQRTDGKLDYTFDWADDIEAPITLVTVSHTVPSELSIDSEIVDTADNTSTVIIAGGVHGGTYLIKALAILSNGLQVPGEATLRVLDS
jgi:hypothetical protein